MDREPASSGDQTGAPPAVGDNVSKDQTKKRENQHRNRVIKWIFLGVRYTRAHPFKVTASVFGLVTTLVAAVTQFDTAKRIVQSSYQRFIYTHYALKRPFDDEIPDADVRRTSSGQAQFDLMRIDGYLGLLKAGPNWKRMCVTRSFPANTKPDPSQFLNTRFTLDPSSVDDRNRQKLGEQVGRHDIDKDEDSEIQRSSDYFTRLSKRSAKQLLFNYKGDVDKLTAAQLYILRNSIFGRHGYHFQTAKLAKLVNRRGWDRAADIGPAEANQVEQCNAFYLAERNPASELGSVGRAVLIKTGANVSDALKAEACSCLSQPKSGVECNEDTGDDFATQFHAYVDFVVDFERGEKANITWTFLDPKDVDQADRDEFSSHVDRFKAAAVEFSAALQEFLAKKSTKIDVTIDNRLGDFWGVKITLPPSLLDLMPSDAATTRDTADAVCSSTQAVLEKEGAIIPPTIERADEIDQTPLGQLTIHPRTVLLGEERRQTLRWFLEKAYPASAANIELDPEAIVLHGTSDEATEAAISKFSLAFDRPADDAAGRTDIGFSTHYLVGIDGQVFRLVDDHFVIRHTAGLDLTSISIVLIGASGPDVHVAQVNATARLVAYLRAKYKTIGHTLDAGEAKQLRGGKIWTEPAPTFDSSLAGVAAPVQSAILAKVQAQANGAR